MDYSLTNLPVEIIDHISSFLESRLDVISLALTCKHTRSILNFRWYKEMKTQFGLIVYDNNIDYFGYYSQILDDTEPMITDNELLNYFRQFPKYKEFLFTIHEYRFSYEHDESYNNSTKVCKYKKIKNMTADIFNNLYMEYAYREHYIGLTIMDFTRFFNDPYCDLTVIEKTNLVILINRILYDMTCQDMTVKLAVEFGQFITSKGIFKYNYFGFYRMNNIEVQCKFNQLPLNRLNFEKCYKNITSYPYAEFLFKQNHRKSLVFQLSPGIEYKAQYLENDLIDRFNLDDVYDTEYVYLKQLSRERRESLVSFFKTWINKPYYTDQPIHICDDYYITMKWNDEEYRIINCGRYNPGYPMYNMLGYSKNKIKQAIIDAGLDTILVNGKKINGLKKHPYLNKNYYMQLYRYLTDSKINWLDCRAYTTYVKYSNRVAYDIIRKYIGGDDDMSDTEICRYVINNN